MKVAALQQFLRNLDAPFSALGVQPHALSAVTACADALEPFHKLELTDLAEFLRRAEEARRTGAVPLVDVPAVAPVGDLARKLGEDVQIAGLAEGEDAREVERRINLHRHQFQSKITDLAQQFGITVTCTETANWTGLLRGRKLVERLRSIITSPESYREPSITNDMLGLTELGDPTLKQLAAEYSVQPTRKKGVQIVEEILAEVTKHRAIGAKTTESRTPKPPKADANQVTEMARSLNEKVALVKQNPHSLSTLEIDELIGEVRTKFDSKQQQEIAAAVTGSKGKTGPDAVIRIRSALASVKQNLDSQNT